MQKIGAQMNGSIKSVMILGWNIRYVEMVFINKWSWYFFKHVYDLLGTKDLSNAQ